MSKNNKNSPQEVETVLANPKGKTVEELKEVVQTLQTQLNQEQVLLSQDKKTIQNRQAKILKMQGALEVILQMVPREEIEEMIAQEAKDNRENGEAVES